MSRRFLAGAELAAAHLASVVFAHHPGEARVSMSQETFRDHIANAIDCGMRLGLLAAKAKLQLDPLNARADLLNANLLREAP